MDYLKIIFGGLVGGILALVIWLIVVHPTSSVPIDTYGAAANVTTIGNPWQFTSTVTIGSSATAITKIYKGTCTLLVSPPTQAASTTQPYDCAVTGAVSGDTVFGDFSTSTPSNTTTGWAVVGHKASTTSGYITFEVMNLTGAAANLSVTGIASTTNYLIIR